MAINNITTTKRTINYFELNPVLLPEKTLNDFTDVFDSIIQISKTKSADRFVLNNDKQLYLTEIKVDSINKRVSGKLLYIRMDSFPELMNTSDDKIRDIEAHEDEGIIETSHFILSFSKKPLILSLEFNQYGPRVSALTFYLEHFLLKSGVACKIDFNPLVRDDLPSYKQRINRISLVLAKVHKDNVKRINEFDVELFDAIATASNLSETEYVTLQLKYDYRQVTDTPRIKAKVMNIISNLIANKDLHSVFSRLIVKAEDESYNNKLREFDLLNIWIKSEVIVQKKPKSKVIVSIDIFDSMSKELSIEFKGR